MLSLKRQKKNGILLFSGMNDNLGDGLAREGSVRRRWSGRLLGAGTGECVGTVIMGEDEARLRDPVHRLELLRGDECLRTRKQTHQLARQRGTKDAILRHVSTPRVKDTHTFAKTTKDTNKQTNDRSEKKNE